MSAADLYRLAFGQPHPVTIPPADPIAYVWRNPATGEELVLDPREVTVVYPSQDEVSL